MAECEFCLDFNPDSTCIGETCLFVKYDIGQKTNGDVAFKAKFDELVTDMSIESLHLRIDLM
ncbi:hypothetical protein KY285_010033 [Solanum tuberosum]|nr:hypothetical protein KY285_010033 [Solanum tuberosum]